ncbi:glycosyltransferase family 1 protein [Candidatus Microgenomates bacterium]|nr:MAG: glycosyltransferase family 1 protein [Candidatus Microgenomates bacterium]
MKKAIEKTISKNSKKKIAFVYDAIYPYIKGGAEKRYYELAKRLNKENYETHLYGMKFWKGPDIIQKEGIFLHGICKAKSLYTDKGKRSIWQAIYFGIHCLKLIKEDFDVIDVNQMPFFNLFSAKLICLIKGKKLYTTWNEVWGRKYWVEYLGKLGAIAYIVEWLSARMPDEIISISSHTTKKLIKELKVKKTIHTIPIGIDFDHIQKIKPSESKSDIIFAGRLLSHKNVDVLIKSVALLKKSLPSIKYLIIGEGPEKNRLEKMSGNLNLTKNIYFLDFFKNHDDLYSLMKSSKVFVLPSTREGFGIVALEANACGIPVVTTNHKDNAAKDLINGENGALIGLNEAELASTIKKLLKKKNNSKCTEFAKNYDWDKITKQITTVYTI